RPERLEPLWVAVRACTENSYRETLAEMLHRLAMVDSVPGADIVHLQPPAEGIPDQSDVEQYAVSLKRLAVPYAVDQRGRASSSLMVTVPGRGLTLILLANSDRLVKPLPLASGDLLVSPIARLFLSLFVR